MSTKQACGCYVAASLADGQLEPSIWYCPMHAAAQELFDAAKQLMAEVVSGKSSGNPYMRKSVQLAEAAIAKAEGTP